jgi:hypothetical protein
MSASYPNTRAVFRFHRATPRRYLSDVRGVNMTNRLLSKIMFDRAAAP